MEGNHQLGLALLANLQSNPSGVGSRVREIVQRFFLHHDLSFEPKRIVFVTRIDVRKISATNSLYLLRHFLHHLIHSTERNQLQLIGKGKYFPLFFYLLLEPGLQSLRGRGNNLADGLAPSQHLLQSVQRTQERLLFNFRKQLNQRFKIIGVGSLKAIQVIATNVSVNHQGKPSRPEEYQR